jgi:flagellar basal-body rod protein FlgB
MELFDTTQLGLEKAIQGAALRHTALSANLANVNTPGFQRRDVDFHGELQAAMGGGRQSVEQAAFAVQDDGSAPVRPDGSTVDLDKEAASLAQNGLEYSALVQVTRARIDILESAIGTR